MHRIFSLILVYSTQIMFITPFVGYNSINFRFLCWHHVLVDHSTAALRPSYVMRLLLVAIACCLLAVVKGSIPIHADKYYVLNTAKEVTTAHYQRKMNIYHSFASFFLFLILLLFFTFLFSTSGSTLMLLVVRALLIAGFECTQGLHPE